LCEHGGKAAGDEEGQIAEAAKRVLDVLAEHGQEQHVAEDVVPAAMHEHCGEPADPPRLRAIARAVHGARIERRVVDGRVQVWQLVDDPGGLFKTFVDVLDNDLLIAKPVVLAATAGSSRHALVVDEQMRSLFAYMRALTLPTSVFAAPEDWGAAELGERVRRAATELAVVLEGQIEKGIADRGWSGYRHEFAGNATRAEQTAADADFDSPLMRLAAGGRAD
jgi:NADPH-dependent FMN reductase